MTNFFAIHAAICSVALSHPAGCTCKTCRAACGCDDAKSNTPSQD